MTEQVPSDGKNHWTSHWDIGDWALPLRIKFFTDPWGLYIELQLLCFSFGYERWAE